MAEHGPAGIPAHAFQAEVAAMGAAGVFDRKPNQERLFQKLASAWLSGEEGGVKEYTLGVEALGRGEDFDPKTDSIVRVEIRKLRQTLEDYAKGAGRERPLTILLPRGAYQLQVLPRAPFAPPAAGRSLPSRRRLFYPAIAAAGAGVLGGAVYLFKPKPVPVAAPVTAPPPPAGPLRSVRILAGNLAGGFIGPNGEEWTGDRYFEGGRAVRDPSPLVLNCDETRLYQYHREGDFIYAIPLEPGVYEVRLYFLEFHYGQNSQAGGGETSRLFRLSINGAPVCDPLDVIAESGGRGMALRKVFIDAEPDKDGKLRLRFESLRPDKAFVNAVEVVPGVRGHMLPLRLAASPQGVRDSEGHLWEADSFVTGGRRASRSEPVQGAASPQLFLSERFGNFTYHLQAVKGRRYTLNIWISEQYFGLPVAPPGRFRSFDLFINGVAVARGVNPLKLAGEPRRALRLSYSGLEPDAYGAIRVHFMPAVNYAAVNALELIDESAG